MKCYNKKLDWLFACCRKCQAQQCFCPSSWTSPGGVGWREMHSVMEASLSPYLIIIACPYLRFPAQRFSTECRYTADSCALFCTHPNSTLLFSIDSAFFRKNTRGGRYAHPHPTKKYRSREKKIGWRGSRIDELEDVAAALYCHPERLTYDVRQDVSASRILLQERPKSLRPAFEILRSAKRNNYGENLFRRRRHHRSFRIARRAAVRPNRISEHRHSLQIQIVFADAFVCFAGAPRAKNNFAGHMRQVIQPDRQPALHRYEINYVHHGVDLRQAFPSNHAPQQRLRRTAVSRWIFPQRLVRHARRLHLRRRQYAAREGQFLDFVLPRLHFFEQRGGRRPRLHLRRHAAQRCSRALRFQFRINRYHHRGLSLQPVSAGPRFAPWRSDADIRRTRENGFGAAGGSPRCS